jgi:hypothetical protein
VRSSPPPARARRADCPGRSRPPSRIRGRQERQTALRAPRAVVVLGDGVVRARAGRDEHTATRCSKNVSGSRFFCAASRWTAGRNTFSARRAGASGERPGYLDPPSRRASNTTPMPPAPSQRSRRIPVSVPASSRTAERRLARSCSSGSSAMSTPDAEYLNAAFG